MGIFGKFFDSKIGSKVEDGLWLQGERQGDWQDLFTTEDGNTWALNKQTCYSGRSRECFGIFRTSTKDGRILYMGCLIEDDSLCILVRRVEDSFGATLARDDWTKGTQIKGSNMSKAASLAQNMAAFNGFSSEPPYVFLLTMVHRL